MPKYKKKKDKVSSGVSGPVSKYRLAHLCSQNPHKNGNVAFFSALDTPERQAFALWTANLEPFAEQLP